MNIIDFTDVNIYPSQYQISIKGSTRIFKIKSFIIENIRNQLDVLINKKSKLLLNDCIKVDTVFGHNTAAKKEEPDNWIDVPVKGHFKIIGIEHLSETDEIELKVKQI